MDNEEIDRFRLATAGDVSSFVARVKKTVSWRERYYFLSQADLKPWTHLVFWHHHDTLGHPTLIVRLGLAFSILTPSERPRFSQAVGMQIFHIPFYLLFIFTNCVVGSFLCIFGWRDLVPWWLCYCCCFTPHLQNQIATLQAILFASGLCNFIVGWNQRWRSFVSLLEWKEKRSGLGGAVSQVEYGVLNMTKEDDARLTVIMDCEGVSHVGFPLHMTKCCCVLVQDHFPMRLASLFLINLHPVLHRLANDIMEVGLPPLCYHPFIYLSSLLFNPGICPLSWPETVAIALHFPAQVPFKLCTSYRGNLLPGLPCQVDWSLHGFLSGIQSSLWRWRRCGLWQTM